MCKHILTFKISDGKGVYLLTLTYDIISGRCPSLEETYVILKEIIGKTLITSNVKVYLIKCKVNTQLINLMQPDISGSETSDVERERERERESVCVCVRLMNK